MKLDGNNHSVFLLCYHLVLVTKYRRKVIDDNISNRLKEIFEKIQETTTLHYMNGSMRVETMFVYHSEHIPTVKFPNSSTHTKAHHQG